MLPRVGRVKLHEDGRRLADLVAAGTARVLSVTVRFERGRWFASFTVETEVSRPAPRLPAAVVGVDLGIRTLAVLSTGEEIPNPRHLSGALRKLRRLSRTASRRQGPDRRTGGCPGSRSAARMSSVYRCIEDPTQKPTAQDTLLVIEVTWPTTAREDLVDKKAQYAAAGIPLYVVVVLDEKYDIAEAREFHLDAAAASYRLFAVHRSVLELEEPVRLTLPLAELVAG